jgi:hypothetical protein
LDFQILRGWTITSVIFLVALIFLIALIALGLTVFALFGPRRRRGFRLVALGLAVVVAFQFALIGIWEVRDWYWYVLYDRKLDRDETVSGIPLPAGRVIRFRASNRISYIRLPRATQIAGIRFTGGVTPVFGGGWLGILAADQNIGGWPCQGGTFVKTRPDGNPEICTLASAHSFFDYELPAGTKLSYWMDDWYFTFPPDKGLAIKVLDTMAPPGIELKVAGGGRLTRIAKGMGKTIIVRGIPLSAGKVEVFPDSVLGELAEPFAIGGEQLSAGAAIRISLANGAVPLAARKSP